MTTKKKKCARPGCKSTFYVPSKNPGKQYCSHRCGAMCRSEEARATASRKLKERNAEARRLGVTREKLLDAKMDAYWRKVEDPYYYQTTRGHISPQSPLGGDL